jgi:hypothetical protein
MPGSAGSKYGIINEGVPLKSNPTSTALPSKVSRESGASTEAMPKDMDANTTRRATSASSVEPLADTTRRELAETTHLKDIRSLLRRKKAARN